MVFDDIHVSSAGLEIKVIRLVKIGITFDDTVGYFSVKILDNLN